MATFAGKLISPGSNLFFFSQLRNRVTYVRNKKKKNHRRVVEEKKKKERGEKLSQDMEKKKRSVHPSG